MIAGRTRASRTLLSGPQLCLVPLLAALALASCATPSSRPPADGLPRPCFEARYSGRFDEGRGPARFVVRVRRCEERLVVEARGRVAGPSFVAAVRRGRARLLIARERLVVDGPDTPEFWLRHAGVPLSGRWLLEGAPAGRRTLGTWTVRVARAREPGAPPRIIEAVAPDGRSLRLERRSIVRTSRGVQWPAVPPGFDHREER